MANGNTPLIEFDFAASQLGKNLAGVGQKMSALLVMYANTKAPQLEAHMKLHRPWTDRTGMAKATLRARVSKPGEDKVRITLSHGVNYGIWLELAHSKNYAIVVPTLQQEGPKAVGELSKLLSKLKF